MWAAVHVCDAIRGLYPMGRWASNDEIDDDEVRTPGGRYVCRYIRANTSWYVTTSQKAPRSGTLFEINPPHIEAGAAVPYGTEGSVLGVDLLRVQVCVFLNQVFRAAVSTPPVAAPPRNGCACVLSLFQHIKSNA